MMYYLYWLNAEGLLQPVIAGEGKKSSHWCSSNPDTAKAAAAWLYENKRAEGETAVVVNSNPNLGGTKYGINKET